MVSERGPRRRRIATRFGHGMHVRRSPEQMAQIPARVLVEVRSKAGQRLEEIGRALNTDTSILKKPIACWLKAKRLKTI